MTIKARLTLAVVVLVVVATGGLGLLVVGAARSSMVDRLDVRLLDAEDRPFRADDGTGDGAGPGLGGGGAPGGGPGAGADRGPSELRSIAEIIVAADGSLVLSDPAGFVDDPEPLPDLPAFDSDENRSMIGRIVTRRAVDGSGRLRVLTTELPRIDGLRYQAISLADVDETARRLWRVFGLTVLLVAGAGAGLAWVIVRRGLQPIDSMIETADAIAKGDLTRRVDHPADATELGRLGAALDEMLTKLEQAFAARTASEDRLKRFAADASHELRTPITAIRGYAELYRSGGLSEAEALDRAMTRIEGESTRMGRLVEDLLLLARLDQQRPLDRVPVDLRAVVLDAAADHRALGDDHPLSVDVRDSEGVTVVGDEAGLRQVVGNLLANARTHTPAGTPMRISLRPDGRGWVLLEVADEGPGLPPTDLHRVFERFYRGDPSRSRATGGAGLGLSIVDAVVAAHGGSISARNAGPGGGAVFAVRLPA